MLVNVEIPDRLVHALESCAREVHSSLQDVAIEAIEKDLARARGPKGRWS